jgi:hypothetical protein
LKYSLKRKEATIAVILLAALLTYARFTNNVHAQVCTVEVQAPTEVQPSTTFNASIIADEIPNQEGGMAGWELILSWTPGVVNCTGEILNYAYWSANSGPLVPDPIDNDLGTYHQALGLRSPSLPVTGTYWLVNLTFLSSSEVSTQINLTIGPAPGLTYCLIDKYSNEIPHEIINSQTVIIPEFLETLLLPLLMILSVTSIMLATKTRKLL